MLQKQILPSLGRAKVVSGSSTAMASPRKRYALYTQKKSRIDLVKVSEHGLGLYYRPKEGRVADCEVARGVKEGWQWMLNRALGFRCHKPVWFRVPVMRRIAITTPNVMAALRRLRRDQARPYNFALSP